MAALPEHRVSPEEYLRLERMADSKSEYYDGVMYAMAGTSPRHNVIVVNLCIALGNALRNTSCRPYVADLRVRVSPERLYAYPDLTVVCGEPGYADDQRDTVLNPVIVVEVLSKSTEAVDRGFKSQQYREMESLKEYFLVSQSEPRIEIYRRQPDSRQWVLFDVVGLDSVCRFESVGREIPLAEIYRDVEFDWRP